MAGRYLLIEFDDVETANRMRAQIDAASRSGKKFRVIGLFSRPGPEFCRCGDWISRRGHQAPTKRGEKFGWTVCLQCKKPVPIMSFLKNLIKPKDIIAPPMYDIVNQPMGFYPYGLTLPTLGKGGFE